MDSHDSNPIDPELAQHIESLPGLYRQVIEWLIDPENFRPAHPGGVTEWEVKVSAYSDLDKLVHIALDMLRVFCLASDGAKVCVLTAEHRKVIHNCLVQCVDQGRHMDEVLQRLDDKAVALMEQANRFLVDGTLNLLECTLRLPEPHRGIFIDMFLGGMEPGEIADGLDGHHTAESVEHVFHEAIVRLGNSAPTG